MDRLTDALIKVGVKIRPNTTIGSSIEIDELFRDGYDAIFMGTGVWKPMKLNIKGESLGHVHFAIEYLRNPNVYRLGNNVVIIGAGSVAVDVARTALRQGSRTVTLVCNKDESAVRARDIEVEYAKIDGVKFEYNKTTLEFIEEGVILADSNIYTDENGNENVEAIPGTEHLYPADSIIVAVSQGPRSVIVKSTEGIDVKNSGLVVTDDCGRTTREGVFASGDVVTGAKTVVEAVRVSKRVAETIDKFIYKKKNEGNI